MSRQMKRPTIGGPLGLRATIRLMLDLGRQFAAIRGKFGHYLLVQPDVHAGGIIAVTGVTELLGKVLARTEAGIDVERLHQVDDRGAPCQLFALCGSCLVHDGCDIDGLCRRSRRRRSGARGRTTSCWRGVGLGAEDRAHNFPENTHRLLPLNLKVVKGLNSTFPGSRQHRAGSPRTLTAPNTIANARRSSASAGRWLNNAGITWRAFAHCDVCVA